jgi:DNA-binding MarR family transcriptional regulator
MRALAEAVSELVEGASRGMARSFDVTRIALLRLAATEGPIRPSEAADALAVNPSTVTRYVRALESEGHLDVTEDPADGRSCRISATEAGRAELARVSEAGMAVFAGVVDDWSAEDLQQFSAYIGRLAGAWSERGPVHTRPHRPGTAPRWKTKRAVVQS